MTTIQIHPPLSTTIRIPCYLSTILLLFSIRRFNQKFHLKILSEDSISKIPFDSSSTILLLQVVFRLIYQEEESFFHRILLQGLDATVRSFDSGGLVYLPRYCSLSYIFIYYYCNILRQYIFSTSIILVITISCYFWWHLLRYVRGIVTSTVMIQVYFLFSK